MTVLPVNNRLLLVPAANKSGKLVQPSIEDCQIDDNVTMLVVDSSVANIHKDDLVILHGSQLDLFVYDGMTYATALAGAVIAVIRA